MKRKLELLIMIIFNHFFSLQLSLLKQFAKIQQNHRYKYDDQVPYIHKTIRYSLTTARLVVEVINYL